ncbi:MAG: hypothetical protein Q7J35_18305 [Candidatus Methanoperedens sp.]|nr:hypothetical protein [Candidatus Methanoperedens sp.]
MEYSIIFGHLFKEDKKLNGKGKINISEEIIEIAGLKRWLPTFFLYRILLFLTIFIISLLFISKDTIVNYIISFVGSLFFQLLGSQTTIKHMKSELSDLKRSGTKITLTFPIDNGKSETLLFRTTNEADAISIENALQSK